MEALLSVSFDNISSKDTTKIRKGLRQIEGLLAQLCLANEKRSSKKHRRTPTNQWEDDNIPQRKLEQIAGDPAFREFFRLQEGFQWNVASRLIECLGKLLGMASNEHTNALLLSTLDLLQGALLLHPPSRILFRRESYMNDLLDLLDVATPPTIQSQALLVLVTTLLATPENTRTFERLDGLLTVASLFKSRSTSREVKMKAIEFFYFYLMPESAPQDGQNKPQIRRAGSAEKDTRTGTRSTEEKQGMLGKYLSNVAELVQDLNETAPFQIAV